MRNIFQIVSSCNAALLDLRATGAAKPSCILSLLAAGMLLCAPPAAKAQNNNTFPSSGYVGVNTTSPFYQLHVRGNSSTTNPAHWVESYPNSTNSGLLNIAGFSAYTSSSTISSGFGPLLLLEEQGANADNNLPLAAIGAVQHGSSEGYGDLQFYTWNGIGGLPTTPAMDINNNGQVGIGTSSPANKLDVYGDSTFLADRAATTTGATFAGAQAYDYWSTPSYMGTFVAQYGSAATGTTVGLSNESLGILQFQNVNAGLIQVNGSDLYLCAACSQLSTPAPQVVLTTGGKFGIGTTSPSYTLQVNGSVAGSSAYVNTSDIRYKKDVRRVPYGLAAVMKLRPIAFNWKDQDQPWKKQHQIGLVAQEVEHVIPEVVTTGDDELHTKSIAYGSIVPVLIKAIQEQQAEIEELKQGLQRTNGGTLSASVKTPSLPHVH